MKRFYKKVFILLIFLGLFGIAYSSLAEEENSTGLQLDWPISPGRTELTDQSNISEMVKYFYEWGISLGGIAVFFSLTIAGFQYLTSVGNESRMREAKDKIKSSLFGLLLLLSSFLILNTINPELTALKIPEDIGSAFENLIPIDVGKPNTSDPCEKIIVYSKTNFQGNSLEILPGRMSENLYSEIGGKALSIEIRGFCRAELYSSNDCTTGLITQTFTSFPDFDSLGIEDSIVCVENSAGDAFSACDVNCPECARETDCIISSANCAWQKGSYLCVESTCNTNCYECKNQSSCSMSEAESGCMWNYPAGMGTCEPQNPD